MKNLIKRFGYCSFLVIIKMGGTVIINDVFFFSFFNWDSPHARLTATTRHGVRIKKGTKKITGYRKSVYKEPKVKRCLLILDLKPLRS